MNPIVRGAGVLRLTLLPVMSSNPLCLWGSTTFRRSAEGCGKEIKLGYIGSLLIESQAIGLSPRAPRGRQHSPIQRWRWRSSFRRIIEIEVREYWKQKIVLILCGA